MLWTGRAGPWARESDAADSGERGRLAAARLAGGSAAQGVGGPLPALSSGLQSLYRHFGDPDEAFARDSARRAAGGAVAAAAAACSGDEWSSGGAAGDDDGPTAAGDDDDDAAAAAKSDAAAGRNRQAGAAGDDESPGPAPPAGETCPDSVFEAWDRPPWELGPAAAEGWDLRFGYGTFMVRYEVDGCLACFSVIDVLPTRVASVYLCYNPDLRHLQWGHITALREIALTDRLRRVSPALRWFDLNFIVPQCSRMDYKAEYKPSLLLCPYTHKWVPLTKERLSLTGAARHGPLADAPASGREGGPDPAPRQGEQGGDHDNDHDVAGDHDHDHDAAAAPCDPDSNAERFDHPAGDMAVAARLEALFAVALPQGTDVVGAWAGDLRLVTLARAQPAPAGSLMALAEAAQEAVLADLDRERQLPGVPVAALPLPRLPPPPGPTPPKREVTLPEPRRRQWPEGSAARRVAETASPAERTPPPPAGLTLVHVSGTDQYLDSRDISRVAKEAMDRLLPELRCLLSPRLEARMLIDPRGVMHFARLDRQLAERLAAQAAEAEEEQRRLAAQSARVSPVSAMLEPGESSDSSG
ncbi:hypothetical protein FNF29_04764 [Cafeteria roenbergensis]|uniref:N-end rule aminoacyl transferase C-terminal domain-containing protein n=1 Tax=Cafeteria roenbergensis TaxID=33653 RepID=A0A5A8CEZ7_CAFRO|nr:hypothetical protein FNF29_04764 [Cafeteria roenbergensis]|eukprot:KAA0151289.1 hypothetical protein FNF29_04764 [Cafeteria roenbergensis]